VTAKALAQFVPQGTPGRVHRLYRTAVYTNTTALVAQRALREGRQFRRQHNITPRDVPAYLSRSARYLGRRFAQQAAVVTVVAPLVFQYPTSQVLKTEATKKNEFIADVSAREKRFKLTAQYVEGLTRFIPALIAQMISRRIKDKNTTVLDYRTTQQLVRNIY